jgi:hypothetical protein
MEKAPQPTPDFIEPFVNENGWVRLDRLPQNDRYYLFNEDFLPYINNPTKVRLLVEDRMARGSAGHCKRCTKLVSDSIERSTSHALTDDGSIIPPYGSYLFESGLELGAWLERYKTFVTKQITKSAHIAINVSNIPYKARAVDIKRTIEEIIDQPNSIVAMDPWWNKDTWTHKGAVTIYLTEKNARTFLKIAEQGDAKMFFNSPIPKEWVLKAWPAKKGTETKESSPTPDEWD